MSNVVRFPTSRRIKVTSIPREEFERLAEIALDVVDRIVAILDDGGSQPKPESARYAELLDRQCSVRYTEYEREDRV